MAKPEVKHLHELTASELRHVQLGILDEVDRACRSLGLTYYLAWGTLLGAVRHGGYIPWDDDIDLMMFRSDYEALAAHLAQAQGTGRWSVGSAQTTPNWPYPFMKVSDERTRWVESSDLAVPIGVNIDIFPIDGHADGSVRSWLHHRELGLVRGLLLLKTVTRRPDMSSWKRLVLGCSKLVLGRVKTSTLTDWFTRSARRYDGGEAREVGVRVGSSDWAVDRRAIDAPQDILFEERLCLGPTDAHAVLAAIYGDYMTLPPVEQRVTHHAFTAFWVR
jgi:lipopolysaccharide cholinephosphotransferase